MSLTPISRDSMLIRRAQKLEEQRKQQIDSTVWSIYHSALSAAESTEDSKYFYVLPVMYNGQDDESEFHRAFMAEILYEVRSLFPGCSVEHTSMIRAQDGQKYDISKIEENFKPFIMQLGQRMECIVVDWS